MPPLLRRTEIDVGGIHVPLDLDKVKSVSKHKAVKPKVKIRFFGEMLAVPCKGCLPVLPYPYIFALVPAGSESKRTRDLVEAVQQQHSDDSPSSGYAAGSASAGGRGSRSLSRISSASSGRTSMMGEAMGR